MYCFYFKLYTDELIQLTNSLLVRYMPSWNVKLFSFHQVSLAEEITPAAFEPAPIWTSSGLPRLPTTWDSQDYFCGSHSHGGKASHSEASFWSRVAWKPHWCEIWQGKNCPYSTCTSGDLTAFQEHLTVKPTSPSCSAQTLSSVLSGNFPDSHFLVLLPSFISASPLVSFIS